MPRMMPVNGFRVKMRGNERNDFKIRDQGSQPYDFSESASTAYFPGYMQWHCSV